MAPHDPRERGFAALLPIVAPVRRALTRAEQAVESERKRTKDIRAGYTQAQRNALVGMTRFAATVRELGDEFAQDGVALRVSNPSQEAQNVFAWLIGDDYYLRVKHEPSAVVDPGTQPLFVPTLTAQPAVVYLTWGLDRNQGVRDVCFATVEDPIWTIPLVTLERHLEDVARLNRPAPKASIRSKKPVESRREERG